MIFTINKNKQKGTALLEFVFYIIFFTILSLLVVNTMITMTKSFRETAIQTELVQAGTIMERISREIRSAYAIASVNATNLVLNTKDENDNDKTVQFLLSGSNLQLLENSVLTGNLNTSNIVITSLIFNQITTTEGKAVKVEITVRSMSDALARTFNFYDTIVLRGEYKK